MDKQEQPMDNMTNNLNENQVTKKGLPAKTFLLVILLAIVAFGLSGYALYNYTKSQNTSTKQTDNITTTITPDPKQTTLTISSLPVKLSTPSSYSTDITINTGNDNVNKVQLEISYDPKMLAKVDINPGYFFTDPQILLKNIDNVNGRISFAIGARDGDNGITGQGVLATLTFTALQKNATASVSLLPKSQVMADGYSQSVLKTTIDGLFELNTTPKSTISGK